MHIKMLEGSLECPRNRSAAPKVAVSKGSASMATVCVTQASLVRTAQCPWIQRLSTFLRKVKGRELG